mmetsp:Transcript_58547/g.155869  ORF Transcript_58547/g.155869 Transcript_58547/m.155869 type:complete len:464 (-) Transcript_58547:72-1463(-)
MVKLKHILGVVALLIQTVVAKLSVFGYVPEYRFESLDWSGVVQRTTHIILFSAEPASSGDLEQLQRLGSVVTPNSNLIVALKNAGKKAPKVLLSIGGAGRSANYAAVASKSKSRKRFANRIRELLEKVPMLAGIDLDWEVPNSVEQWRDFGKLAREVRASIDEVAGPGARMLTTTVHPNTGAVRAFASLRSKKDEGKSFVELFDVFHAMAYAQMGPEGHSPMSLAKQTVLEWTENGLDPRRLSLGVPLFGVNKRTGEAISYGEIVDKEPSIVRRSRVDETNEGVVFNNAKTLKMKVRHAARQGLAGITVWELGQDKPASSRSSLLSKLWAAAENPLSSADDSDSMLGLAQLFVAEYVTEDNLMLAATLLAGAFYLLQLTVFASQPAHRKLYSRRPPPRSHLSELDEAEEADEADEAEDDKDATPDASVEEPAPAPTLPEADVIEEPKKTKATPQKAKKGKAKH